MIIDILILVMGFAVSLFIIFGFITDIVKEFKGFKDSKSN